MPKNKRHIEHETSVAEAIGFEGSTKSERLIYYLPHFLMAIFIFLSPFTQDTSIKEICFYTSALFFLWAACYRKKWVVLWTPLTMAFLLFLAWALAGIPAALNRPNTIHDIYAHWIKYIFIYYLLLNYFQKPGEFIRLAFIIVMSGWVYSVWYICYFYFYLGHSWSERLVMYPYRDYLFVFSFMIAIGLIQYQASRIIRSLATLALVCILAAAILSQSRNVVLAIGVGAMVYMLRFRKIAVGVITILIISGISFTALRERLSLDELAQSDRIATNLITIEMIKDFSIFGIGFGMQTYGYKDFVDLHAYQQQIPNKFKNKAILGSPHNFLLDTTVRTGILGGILLLFLYVCELRMLLRIYRWSENDIIKGWGIALAASFAAFLVQSQFGDAAFGLQAIVFFTILAMTTILWRHHQQYQVTR